MRSIVAAVVLLAGCQTPSRDRLVVTTQPGLPILVMNDTANGSRTALLANQRGKAGDVSGRLLVIATYIGGVAFANHVALDDRGDIGIRGGIRANGSISTRAQRSATTDRTGFNDDPLALLSRTRIVSYRYRLEAPASNRHIGIIAEDSPRAIGGAGHDRFDVGNALAVDVAATQAIERRLDRLDRDVSRLEKTLR
jgi:hypothetical protein